MKSYFAILVFMFSSTQAFAVDSVAQCLPKAQAIASALDSVNGSHYAELPVATRSASFFNEADVSTQLHLIYSFGIGESILEVTLKPNYYSAGDCVFASATLLTQD
ncbi:hypothetical protein [Bdellovibrio sp. NC01]|uniref:hypothetical protein n=1 Tax=Bdellovibrio sp. NC01 TaxID=2220073 RepID=UPI00115A7AC5|nr:hypothetical protein [Bdellovibrio sp. NC01]QDK38187.1 hypothetical protein DOE51_11635 [Bdellovibrio sp. NC01]